MARSALLLVAAVAGCHGASPDFVCSPRVAPRFGPARLTPEAEALAGALAAPALEACYGGVVHNEDAEDRMERIGHRLCRSTPEIRRTYRYRLLDSYAINAFSLPGGRIYVTRGLYARLVAEELLAAVLAHEMAHLAAGDHLKPLCRNHTEALSRELSADARAVAYLHAASIPPETMICVIQLIQAAQPSRRFEIRGDMLVRSLDDGALGASGLEGQPEIGVQLSGSSTPPTVAETGP